MNAVSVHGVLRNVQALFAACVEVRAGVARSHFKGFGVRRSAIPLSALLCLCAFQQLGPGMRRKYTANFRVRSFREVEESKDSSIVACVKSETEVSRL